MKVSHLLSRQGLVWGLALAAVLFTPPVTAAEMHEDISQLKAELLSLIKRVERLEAENQLLSKAAPAPANKQPNGSWSERMAFTGDFRYRYEHADVEGSNIRERHRIRTRGLLSVTPVDNIELGLGYAGGTDAPRSSHQTLGEGGSTKDLRLDQAYFKWQPRPGLSLMGGKMKTPWFRAGGNTILWDNNYRPEGAFLTYAFDALFLKIGYNLLESDTQKNNARGMYGIQAGMSQKTSIGKLTAGFSYFDFDSKDRGVPYGKADRFFGNSYACNGSGACTYLYDYQIMEAYAELKTKWGSTFFMDYVKNRDADSRNTGWAAGVKFARGQWDFTYRYVDLEADATFAHLTAADFNGGYTDTQGHTFIGAWALNKKWKLSFDYFTNNRDVSAESKHDYDKLRLSSTFKF